MTSTGTTTITNSQTTTVIPTTESMTMVGMSHTDTTLPNAIGMANTRRNIRTTFVAEVMVHERFQVGDRTLTVSTTLRTHYHPLATEETRTIVTIGPCMAKKRTRNANSIANTQCMRRYPMHQSHQRQCRDMARREVTTTRSVMTGDQNPEIARANELGLHSRLRHHHLALRRLRI